MIEAIIMGLVMLLICAYKDVKIEELKEKIAIKESENLSLKRVMYENDLIPGEYVR